MGFLDGKRLVITSSEPSKIEEHIVCSVLPTNVNGAPIVLVTVRVEDGTIHQYMHEDSETWRVFSEHDYVHIRLADPIHNETSPLADAQLRLLNSALGEPIPPESLSVGDFGELIGVVKDLVTCVSTESEPEGPTREK